MADEMPRDNSKASDEDLMLWYYGCDDAAFAELFRRLTPILMAIAFRMVGRRPGRDQLAEDLVQETWIKVVATKGRQSTGWTPGRASVKPFVIAILVTLFRAYLRRLNKEHLDCDLTPEDGEANDFLGSIVPVSENPSSPMVKLELLIALEECLKDKLTEDQRFVIVLLMSGLSQTEIAEVLGRSDTWVHHRKMEALEALARCLKAKGFDLEDVQL